MGTKLRERLNCRGYNNLHLCLSVKLLVCCLDASQTLVCTYHPLFARSARSNYQLAAIEQVVIFKDTAMLGLESCGDQSTKSRLITFSRATMSCDILVRVSQRLLNPIFI